MRKIFGRQHNQTVIDFYNKRYDEDGSMCPPSGWGWQHTHGRSTFYHKYNERCRVSEILADEVAVKISSVPTERTQTPEEALQLSIWSPHTTFNISTLRFFVCKEKPTLTWVQRIVHTLGVCWHSFCQSCGYNSIPSVLPFDSKYLTC